MGGADGFINGELELEYVDNREDSTPQERVLAPNVVLELSNGPQHRVSEGKPLNGLNRKLCLVVGDTRPKRSFTGREGADSGEPIMNPDAFHGYREVILDQLIEEPVVCTRGNLATHELVVREKFLEDAHIK